MLLTLILQYLNKLVEGEIRYFSAPKPFHTVKVQGFIGNRLHSQPTALDCWVSLCLFP